MGGGILNTKNAFTLIELLAIIVILAIIAVITVPIILNIIENSRKGAATDSAYGYKDAVNKAYISELAKPNQESLKLDGTYEVQPDGTLKAATGSTFGIANYTLPVSVSGDKPSAGELHYTNNILQGGCLVIGDYQVIFETDGSVDTAKGDCSTYEYDDGNYLYSVLDGSEPVWEEQKIDPSYFDVYFRKDKLTSKIEICSDSISNVTVCLSCESYNSTTGACINTIDYMSTMRTELGTKGVSCEFEEDRLHCIDPNLDEPFWNGIYFIADGIWVVSPNNYSCGLDNSNDNVDYHASGCS